MAHISNVPYINNTNIDYLISSLNNALYMKYGNSLESFNILVVGGSALALKYSYRATVDIDADITFKYELSSCIQSIACANNIPIIHSVFSIKDTANMASASCQALDYILSSLAKKFESPIFFACRNIHHTTTSVATDCFLIDSMDYGFSADDENDNMPWLIPYVLGKWSKTDTSNLVDDLIGCVERSDEDSKFYEEGNLFPYSLYRVSDFEQFKHELSRFSRMVAERFNLATKGIDLKPHVSSSAPVTDTELFEEMTLNVSDIKLPDTIKGDVAIPSFVKKQVKQNCLKHIRIYDDNVVSKEDASIVIYLRSLGVKTVLCKKKKVTE